MTAICNAYKGNTVVILDVEDYIKEAIKQLSHDPTWNLLNRTIDNFKNEKLLDEKIAND